MPDPVTIEALAVAQFEPLSKSLSNMARSSCANLEWQAPAVVHGAANQTITVWDNTTKKSPLADVYIQNIGTSAIYYAINTDCNANTLNGILAGGSAANDGLGSQLVLKGFRGKLSVFSTAAYDAATLIGRFSV